jgi:hypothetical protein
MYFGDKPYRVTYLAVDGYRESKRFKTIEGARKFAQRGVGEFPEFGGTYAVSFDGVGTVRWDGLTFKDLFPKAATSL